MALVTPPRRRSPATTRPTATTRGPCRSTNIFSYNDGTDELDPHYTTRATQYDFYTSTADAFSPFGFQRCPGAASQPAAGRLDARSSTRQRSAASAIPPTIPFGVTHEARSSASSPCSSRPSALVVVGSGASEGDGDEYLVRAIFDNGGFLVPGEEVRIAGAQVGSIDSVDVTLGEEAAHEDGSADPGKAVVVLRIDDPGFQDFREDASCLIRPQSLLGEKFVECQADPAARRRAPSRRPS